MDRIIKDRTGRPEGIIRQMAGGREELLTNSGHPVAYYDPQTEIRKLRERVPMTTEFERVLLRRGVWSNSRVWYTSQKEHWLGWLSEYRGLGYYGREDSRRSAEFVYNHIVCPPMVLWLAEASGIPKAKVAEAKRTALSAKPHLPAQSAAIRKIIPWRMIEVRLDPSGRKRWGLGQTDRILSAHCSSCCFQFLCIVGRLHLPTSEVNPKVEANSGMSARRSTISTSFLCRS